MTINILSFVLSVFPILFILDSSNGEVIPFHSHRIYALQPEYWTFHKFQSKDAPHWSPGHGHSFIDLSGLKFQTLCSSSSVDPTASDCKDSTLDILMFEEPNEHWLDYWPSGQFCCNQDLVDSGDCNTPGTLIYPPDFPNSVITRLKINSKSTEPTVLNPNEIIYNSEIKSTDVCILFLANCDIESSPIVITGKIESLDPYGYLPGDQFGYMPFYELLSVFYLILAVGWAGMCYYNIHELIILQYWISGVLSFGLLETALLYGYYLNWNDTGLRHNAILILGIICGVSKRTLSRIVIQFVALGYGIVRPTLGTDFYRVLYLAGMYFILSLIYILTTKFSKRVSNVDDPTYNMISLVVLMLAGIDTTFYIWIITSLNNIITTLAARKQVLKYLLYRNFRIVLFTSLFFTFIWVLYGSMITVNNGHGDKSNWQYTWTIDCLWEFTYYILFLTICILWAPYKNNHRFAYSYELVSSQEAQLRNDEEWNAAGTNQEQLTEDGDDDAGGGATYGNNSNRNNQQQQQQRIDRESTAFSKSAEKKRRSLLDDDDEDDNTVNNASNKNNNDGDNLFQGGGALDSKTAILKKN